MKAKRPPATCKDCHDKIVEFSKAHCIDDNNNVWQHCKCRGCPKTSFGDYACVTVEVRK